MTDDQAWERHHLKTIWNDVKKQKTAYEAYSRYCRFLGKEPAGEHRAMGILFAAKPKTEEQALVRGYNKAMLLAK